MQIIVNVNYFLKNILTQNKLCEAAVNWPTVGYAHFVFFEKRGKLLALLKFFCPFCNLRVYPTLGNCDGGVTLQKACFCPKLGVFLYKIYIIYPPKIPYIK